MKRTVIFIILMIALPFVGALAGLTEHQINVLNTMYQTFYPTFGTDLDALLNQTFSDKFIITEISAPSGNPDSGDVWFYAKAKGGTNAAYIEIDDGTVIEIGAGAVTALDDIADPDGNGTIDQTGYKTTWTSTLNSAGAVWTFTNTTADLTADVSFIDLKYTDDGDANGYFLRGYDAGTSLKWSIGVDGAGVFGALSGTTGTFTEALEAAGITLTGDCALGDGTGDVAIDSSSWGVSTAGVATLTGLSFTDDITLSNGKALNCGTTTGGHIIYLDVYDNDSGPAWVHALTLTNGNTPAVAIGNGGMTVAVDSSTWDVSTAGTFTGVTGMTITTGNHLTLGTTQWDNGSDKIDGEQIADDTIDDDAIDFSDVTGADLTLNDCTGAIKTTSTLECDGSANFADTTAGADVTMGNSTGNLTFLSDNADFTLTDTTDNVFQLVNSGGAVLFDIDLGATDAITIGSSAENVVLNGANVGVGANGNFTVSGSITGDGGDELTGFLKLVTVDTDDQALLVGNSGSVWTNAGAIAAQTFTLPAAAAGLEFTFIVMAAQELRVDPAAGDVIYINAVGADAGEYWTANAVGESLHLIAVDNTNWIAVSHVGTWTQETP